LHCTPAGTLSAQGHQQDQPSHPAGLNRHQAHLLLPLQMQCLSLGWMMRQQPYGRMMHHPPLRATPTRAMSQRQCEALL
jgi:hypothetical protein